MSGTFSDDEIKQILGEAARLAVEKENRDSSGHSYDDLAEAAKESGIDPNHVTEAMARVDGKFLLVRDEAGETHVRKLSWERGDPGKWRKYPCAVDCTLKARCPLAKWDHVIKSCEERYQVKRSFGAITQKPATDGPLVKISPNGRFLLFSASYGPLIEGLFTRFLRELGARCQEALGIVDLREQKAGILMASVEPLIIQWTGPATFRFDLNGDVVSLRKRGASIKLLARLYDRSSQIFVHLGDDPGQHVLTRVDAYRIE